MTSKATRRSRQRNRTIALAGGDVTTPPPVQGQRKAENPMAVAITARQRHTGIHDPDDARQPIAGTEVGLCIRYTTTGDDRAALVNTWEAMGAAHRNYRMMFMGQTGNPQGAAIGFIPDRMQTNDSLRVDIRTPEEKVAGAKSAWASWEGRIAKLQAPPLRWALKGALDGFMGEGRLWQDQQPTPLGKTVVMALREVAK